jgi:DNA-binding LytR/AlgR family response regulator
MNNKLIPVFSRSEVLMIREDDIISAVNQARLVVISTVNREYRYYGKLSDLMELLSDHFFQCHSNVMVNFDKVMGIKENGVHMADGRVILMGRNAYLFTRRNFIHYLEKSYKLKRK